MLSSSLYVPPLASKSLAWSGTRLLSARTTPRHRSAASGRHPRMRIGLTLVATPGWGGGDFAEVGALSRRVIDEALCQRSSPSPLLRMSWALRALEVVGRTVVDFGTSLAMDSTWQNSPATREAISWITVKVVKTREPRSFGFARRLR